MGTRTTSLTWAFTGREGGFRLILCSVTEIRDQLSHRLALHLAVQVGQGGQHAEQVASFDGVAVDVLLDSVQSHAAAM